jgi:predicted porin
MKRSLTATAAIVAILAATSVARADEIGDIKAQSIALKKQNAALEARLNKLEKQQSAQARKLDQTKFVAQQAATPAAPESFLGMVTKGPIDVITDEGPISWHGITIFGTFDAGLGWVSHGLPENGQNYEGESLINKFTNRPYFGVAQNGLSQTTLGIKGEQEIIPGWAGVFMASTGINPQSGQLANMPGTLNANQGLNRANYSFSGDGGRGGQAFNDQLYVGVNSHDFGQLTFGRHRPFSQELMVAYDPAGGAYDFSPIGFSGAYVQGLGNTENARWDDSLKYKLVFENARFGAMYKFADGNGGNNVGTGTVCPIAGVQPAGCTASNYVTATNYATKNNAGQIGAGASYGGLDVDGVLGFFHQSVGIAAGNSPLSSAQLAGLDNFQSNSGQKTNSIGNNNFNTLSATIADTTGGAIGAKYTWNQFKFFAGWAHDIMHNPANSVGIGATNDQGGYILSSVNNNNFPHAKLLDTEWTGVKYAYNPRTDITLAYYHVRQNTFNNDGTCAAKLQNAHGAGCGGTLDAVSAYVDYHFNKRFDVYGGMLVSNVEGGLANGYNYYTNFAPSAGVRYSF